jgi:NADPH:quinone reductase-like Zn-dependent oxidoreductase
MKSYHANKGGGFASLIVKEHDIPTPGPHEVVVRVRASALNYRDLAILQGTYPLPIKPDGIPLADGAGEVIAVGTDVTRAKPGDRVVATPLPQWIDEPFFPGWDFAAQIGGSLDGLLTEYALLHEEWLVPIPDHLSFEEAAALPTAGVTAWNALTGARPLQAGETVLILGSGVFPSSRFSSPSTSVRVFLQLRRARKKPNGFTLSEQTRWFITTRRPTGMKRYVN